MKTLDEVIRFLEEKQKIDDWDIRRDALHYLKEYQGLSKMWNDKLDKEQANPPLTWDELKGMAGKPVWLEHPKTGEAHWAIIGNWYDESEMRLFLAEDENAYYVSRELYEEGILQAYRKERE